ncbi:unnamed protein product [Phaedon cochleariae]|uniref:Uncharacterized protein n=1 Tax=Phaedon cochleariae TaxID=80249 RepID=A0A9N9SB47_PHACE|nr:unnamed protein product [Phaedon cochleariae]
MPEKEADFQAAMSAGLPMQFPSAFAAFHAPLPVDQRTHDGRYVWDHRMQPPGGAFHPPAPSRYSCTRSVRLFSFLPAEMLSNVGRGGISTVSCQLSEIQLVSSERFRQDETQGRNCNILMLSDVTGLFTVRTHDTETSIMDRT